MSHPNEAMLRHAYEAFAVGDLDPVLGMLSDDISWHASGDSPVAGDYSGREGVLRFFAAMMTQYGGTLRLQVNDVLASDDHGVVLTTESGTAGGERIEWASVHVFTIRDGKCVRFVSYEDDAYHQFWAARRVAA